MSVSAVLLWQVVWRFRQKVSECSTPMTGSLEIQTKGQWVQYTYDRWSGDSDKRSVRAVHLWQVVWRFRQKVNEYSSPTICGLEMQTKCPRVQYTYDRRSGDADKRSVSRGVQYIYDSWSGDADKRSVSTVHLWKLAWGCRQVSEYSTSMTRGLVMQKKSMSTVHLRQVVWRGRQDVSEYSTPTKGDLSDYILYGFYECPPLEVWKYWREIGEQITDLIVNNYIIPAAD